MPGSPEQGGEIKSRAHPRLLFAQGVGVQGLALGQRPQQIEIELVTDQVRRGANLGLGFRCPPGGIAGAEPDHRERPTPPTDGARIKRCRRPGNGTGRARRLGLGRDQLALCAGGGERRALGDAVAADLAKHQLGRPGEARGLSFQARGRKEARRYAQSFGDGMHCRLVGLEVEGDHRGDRALGEIVLGQGIARERQHFSGVRAALATQAQTEGRGLVDQRSRVALVTTVGHTDCQFPVLGERQAARLEPGRPALKAQGRAIEQRHHEDLVVPRVG